MNDDESDGCPATNRNGDPCGHPAGWGTDNDEGPCKHHGGKGGDVGDPGGPPEGSANAETHSLTSDPSKYYDRQPEPEQDKIDGWAESWAKRAGYAAPGFDVVLHEAAVTLHQIFTADTYIGREGVIVEKVIDETEDGRPIRVSEENPALKAKSRATSDVIRTLKEFGVLDDPDSQMADSVETIADVLKDE